MFKHLKLGKKIGFGFAAILVLFVIAVGSAYYALDNSSDGFTQYREMARDSNLSGNLQSNMLMVRMNVKDFIITGSDDDLKQYRDYVSTMNGFLNEAHQNIQDPERAQAIDHLTALMADYDAAFDQVIDYREQRNELLYNSLTGAGANMENELTEIMISAEADKNAKAAFHTGLAIKHLLLGRLYVSKFLDSNAQSDVDRVFEEFSKMQEQLGILDAELQNETRRELLASVTVKAEQYKADFGSLAQIIFDRNKLIDGTLDVIGPAIAADAESIKQSIIQTQNELGPALVKSNNQSISLIVSVGLASIVIGIFISVFTSRSIVKPITLSAAHATMVAEGDFSKTLEIDQRDEVGQLADALNKMTANLSEVVMGIRNSSDQVAASAEELSASSQSLANAANEQASSLEETSSSIEQLNGSIAQNSQNAQSTNQTASKAALDAEEGGAAVTETVTDMKRIAERIAIINDIADQTNLLALNAAIEAARAGDMGKGFAVVAVEVRKLAERSQEAAKEISELAKGSVAKAERAGEMITNVVPAIQNASKLMQEITVASEEQASGASQIRAAVQQLDMVTQQNSSTSEECASSSEELAAQAQVLQELISRFVVRGDVRSAGGYMPAGSAPKTNGKRVGAKEEPMSFERSRFALVEDENEWTEDF